MNFRAALGEMAVSFMAGVVNELADSTKRDAAGVRSYPDLKQIGAEIAAELVARSELRELGSHEKGATGQSDEPSSPTIIDVTAARVRSI